MSDLELLKNINDIDDDLLCEAETWKRPKTHKLRITVIAAAAALGGTLLAVTGAAAINRAGSENNAYSSLRWEYDPSYIGPVKGENIVQAGDYKFYLDLEVKDIIIPEEYRTFEEHGCPWHNERMRGMLPSELFAQFGVSPLLNDNFSENVEFEPNHIRQIMPNGTHKLVDVDYGDPVLLIDDGRVIFSYRLYNKITQRNITLHATYIINEEYSSTHGIGIDDDSDYEIIELNDGSMCYLDMGGAVFSYEGVEYTLNMYDKAENNDEQSVELTKLTLKALGVC